jgi:hypothetical protein
MNHRTLLRTLLVCLLASVAPCSRAASLTADEQAFFNAHAADMFDLQTERLEDPALAAVFASPFYKVTAGTKLGDANGGFDLLVTRVGDTLVGVAHPGTDMDLPDLFKLLNPKFRLRNMADAKLLQQALDIVYPIIMSSDQKLKSNRRNGKNWTFIRGDFLEGKRLGFVFETDPAGAIKSVKYSLQLQ